MTDRSNPGPAVAAHHASGRGVVRVPYPIGIRRGEVVSREQLTEHMVRVTVRGEELRSLPTYAADDHVRLVFPLPDGTRNDPVPDEDSMLEWRRPHPPSRKYTIRRFDASTGELTLDFVVHEGGLAAEWAAAATAGDEVVVAGPPGAKAFAHTYRRYICAVDTTGLPALARWLEESSWIEERGVVVDVLIDHDHDAETGYPLPQRDGVTVQWLRRDGGSRLAERVAALDLEGYAADEIFLFAAGEADDLKPVRRWASEAKIAALVTGYWKRGVADLDD